MRKFFFVENDVINEFKIPDSTIYFQRKLNYVPLFIFGLSLFFFFKTIIFKRCCILKGWKLKTLALFNFEIAVIFFIPFLFITLTIICIYIFLVCLLYKTLKLIFEFCCYLNNEYNRICAANSFSLNKELNQQFIKEEPIESFKVTIHYDDNTYGNPKKISKRLHIKTIEKYVKDLEENGYICVFENEEEYLFKKKI